MAVHRRASSSGLDSAVLLTATRIRDTAEDGNIYTLNREDRRFERAVKEAIYIKQTLNRGFQISKVYFTLFLS